MNITVHIERLILDVLPLNGSDGAVIQAVVEIELARLLARQGLPGMSADSITNIFAGPIQLESETKPAHLGYQIAQAIHTGFESLGANSRPRTARGGPGT